MCLYPKLIKNKKYTVTKKNGGNVPICDDRRKLLVPVGCGKCIECMKQKSRNWQVRLNEDIRHNKNGKFVTLTFNTESLIKIRRSIKGLDGYELDNEIARVAVKKFLGRWRKEFKRSIRHWLITELGHEGTEHLHIHGILWTDESKEVIDKKWKYGYTWIGDYMTEKTVNYITKYVTKVDGKHKEYKSVILTSAGIGRNYIDRTDSKLNRYKDKDTKESYTNRNGTEQALPIYYRNKIYNEEEREKLWVEKLDKEERWVCGERVDVSTNKGWEEYYKLVEYYREKNRRLGYGDDEKNWERKKYENDKRKMIQDIRINGAMPSPRAIRYNSSDVEKTSSGVFTSIPIALDGEPKEWNYKSGEDWT